MATDGAVGGCEALLRLAMLASVGLLGPQELGQDLTWEASDASFDASYLEFRKWVHCDLPHFLAHLYCLDPPPRYWVQSCACASSESLPPHSGSIPSSYTPLSLLKLTRFHLHSPSVNASKVC